MTDSTALVLAADIGDTHATFRFSEIRENVEHETVVEKAYLNQDFDNFRGSLMRVRRTLERLEAESPYRFTLFMAACSGVTYRPHIVSLRSRLAVHPSSWCSEVNGCQ